LSTKPSIGSILKRYIKDVVYGANDGIVTTFAVIASVVGAGLDAAVILIVGFASLIADGLSMASSSYLASSSERAALENRGQQSSGAAEEQPAVAALFTFLSFVAAGSLPLLPYAIVPSTPHIFWLTAVAAAIALLLIGAGRTLATGRPPIRASLEMLFVGGASRCAEHCGRSPSQINMHGTGSTAGFATASTGGAIGGRALGRMGPERSANIYCS